MGRKVCDKFEITYSNVSVNGCAFKFLVGCFTFPFPMVTYCLAWTVFMIAMLWSCSSCGRQSVDQFGCYIYISCGVSWPPLPCES
jgi:hypothetical protein